MFDDTYEHEVWNNTDQTRAVLFMDVVRPLRFPVALLNSLIFRLVRQTGYVQQAKKNQEHWEQKPSEVHLDGAERKDEDVVEARAEG